MLVLFLLNPFFPCIFHSFCVSLYMLLAPLLAYLCNPSGTCVFRYGYGYDNGTCLVLSSAR
uniref:Uncharacterized protein n=1 Tax=Helianthus annuus TaxID=4232 RepID=A0A251S4D6_HELAN